MAPFVQVVWPASTGISVLSTVTGANTTSGTSHTVNLPTGAATGDLILVCFRISDDTVVSSPETVITLPSGWTEEASRYGMIRVMSRVRQSGDPTSVTITTDTSRRSAYIGYRVGNAHGDVDVGSFDGTLDPTSVTPAWGSAENLWVTFISSRKTNMMHGPPPTNYGSQLDAETGANLDLTTHCCASAAHRIATASSEDPDAWGFTGTQNQTLSCTIAVRPSA